jgi:hypothetical protein
LIFIEKDKKTTGLVPFGKGFVVNTTWIVLYALFVNNDFVLLTTTATPVFTIAVVANSVSNEVVKLNQLCRVGNSMVTRKNPRAIVADFVPSIQHNY